MTLQLAPLTSSILSLAWLGEPGITYTIQVSGDMSTWETLPHVVAGSGSEESYFIDLLQQHVFVRLQFDGDGDTDDNALPDYWEWQNFGYIGTDPDADPDLDGLSTYAEWLQQTDPLDYYNGEWPLIHVTSGRQWLVPAGNISSNGVSLSLQKPSGEPWAHAPVTLSLDNGAQRIVRVDSKTSTQYATLLVWTDSLGRINPGIESVHVLASEAPGDIDELVIRAGQSDAAIMIHSIGESFGPPPRDLRRQFNSSGQQTFTWKGDPGTAGSFIIEQMNGDGQWSRVVQIAVSDLSPPDPLYGTYQLTIAQ